eukprot:SAG11_NODE_6292_length_1343_cov_1.631029_1_plen_213_part_00
MSKAKWEETGHWEPSVADLIPSSIKTGPIAMQPEGSNKSAAFRDRWFVLIRNRGSGRGPRKRDDHMLFYFERQTGPGSQKPAGLIWLPAGQYQVGRPTAVRAGHEHCLRLDVRPKKLPREKYVLSCRSDAERQAWTDSVRVSSAAASAAAARPALGPPPARAGSPRPPPVAAGGAGVDALLVQWRAGRRGGGRHALAARRGGPQPFQPGLPY